MALRLENKNALITGGASGIGRATSIRFAEEGANVAVADRNLGAADSVAAEVRKLGRKAIAIQVDTSDEAQVDAMVARTVADLGSIDILVAAAGISHARYGEEGAGNPAPLSAKAVRRLEEGAQRQPRWRVSVRSRGRARNGQGRQGRQDHQYRFGCGEAADSRRRRVCRQQGGRMDAQQGARGGARHRARSPSMRSGRASSTLR